MLVVPHLTLGVTVLGMVGDAVDCHGHNADVHVVHLFGVEQILRLEAFPVGTPQRKAYGKPSAEIIIENTSIHVRKVKVRGAPAHR
jgi:hypothetical protein